VTVHKSLGYHAYAIFAKDMGKVRIFNKHKESSLLKTYKGRVVDLAFAYCDEEVLLAFIDETGCLQIYEIVTDENNKIITKLVFHLKGTSNSNNTTITSTHDDKEANTQRATSNKEIYRVQWCNYHPDPNSSITNYPHSKVFIISSGDSVNLCYLDLLRKTYEASETTTGLDINDLTVENGILSLKDPSFSVTINAFSPDCSAFASASTTGEVRLYKIPKNIFNLEGGDDDDDEESDSNNSDSDSESSTSSVEKFKNYTTEDIILKRYIPHGNNKPITSLYFLDDHSKNEFWTFLLTGIIKFLIYY
jgi:hypothetical protein